MGWRWIAPAGAPIGAVDVCRWASRTLVRRDPAASLRQEIASRFDVRHVYLSSTGRAGMTLLLKALHGLTPTRGDEVVLPTYTCYSVAASVIKAGLRPRLVDIRPDTLDYCPDQLAATDFSRVLAIVATNLYGLPSDLPGLSALARTHDLFLIDDAAQAMGASVAGRRSGTWGDAGLFSFDKGKNVSAIDGGVVVSGSDRVAAALTQEWERLHAPSTAQSGKEVLKALAYTAMLRPWLYGIPARIPQLGLGKTMFTTDFPLELPSPPLTALAETMMRSLDSFNRTRTENAGLLAQALAGIRGVTQIRTHAEAAPVYLRFPLLVPTAPMRSRVLTSLKGLGATASYPSSLADVPDLRGVLANPEVDAEGGRHVAAHIVTLPTHPYVTRADISRMARLVRQALGPSQPGKHTWSLAHDRKGALK